MQTRLAFHVIIYCSCEQCNLASYEMMLQVDACTSSLRCRANGRSGPRIQHAATACKRDLAFARRFVWQ